MEIKEFESLREELTKISERIDKNCQYKAEKLVIITTLIIFLFEKIEITNEEKLKIFISLGKMYIDNEC